MPRKRPGVRSVGLIPSRAWVFNDGREGVLPSAGKL